MKNLIFLISQPRSGSSLLQQLLLNSNMIYSTPEPWFMLSLVYFYKLPNLSGNYNPNFCQINFMRYLEKEQIELDKVKKKIKNLALDFYAMSKVTKDQYFLDKTPRYYHIIDDLMEIFPKAKFILLQRNPLSVFSSILSYNFKGNYKAFLNSEDRIYDLFAAPHKILKHKNCENNRCIYIKYEDLIAQPDIQMHKLFRFLEAKIPGNISEYQIDRKFLDSDAVDKKSLHHHSKPVSEYVDSWKNSIDTVAKKQCAKEYLSILGKNAVVNLGYSFDRILTDLSAHKVRLSLEMICTSKFFDNLKIQTLLSQQ